MFALNAERRSGGQRVLRLLWRRRRRPGAAAGKRQRLRRQRNLASRGAAAPQSPPTAAGPGDVAPRLPAGGRHAHGHWSPGSYGGMPPKKSPCPGYWGSWGCWQ